MRFPEQYRPADVPASHLEDIADHIDPDVFEDWSCGWTHFIDVRTATVATWRRALAATPAGASAARSRLQACLEVAEQRAEAHRAGAERKIRMAREYLREARAIYRSVDRSSDHDNVDEALKRLAAILAEDENNAQ